MRSLAFLLFLLFQVPNIGLRVIAVKTESQARDLRARIQKGESFEDLARKYSSDTTAQAGGYLGAFTVRDLRREFQDGIARLHPGDVSPVLKVGGDYILLQLIKPEEARWQEEMAAGRQAFQQKRYTDADRSFQAAIRDAERFGPQDARLGASLNSLGIVYFAETNYAAAEPLYKRALTIRADAFGPNHPDVAATLNNLAELYWSQQKYAAAEPLYKRVLAITEKNAGSDSSEVVTAINNLADVYRALENYAAAEPLYKRALAINEIGRAHV